MKNYNWNDEKNELLKQERNVSFKDAVEAIERGDLLDVLDHPNSEKYANQRLFIVKMRDYAWLVPFVETDHEIFLKTIIPNRKATKKYLRKQP